MTAGWTVGVIGGYGATGEVVVRQLIESTDCDVIVGGRDGGRAAQLAERMGARARATAVEAMSEAALDSFCGGCQLIVNCAGPSSVVGARVALAAMRHNCHYLDPGGYRPLVETLRAHRVTLERSGLTFIVSAGWIPGLCEVFVHYVDAIAREQLEDLERLDVYYGDRSAWSRTGVVDIAWHAVHSGECGAFVRGGWLRRNELTAARLYRFPTPIGRQLVMPHYKAELSALARDGGYRCVCNYVGLMSVRTLLAMGYARTFLRGDLQRAARLIGASLKRDRERCGGGGAVCVTVDATASRTPVRLVATLLEDRHYWVTGVVPATAARMLMSGTLASTGCNYLCDAVDPRVFMAEMGKLSVRHSLLIGARG
jgi:saccharopine dehydrogenase (NAD+, L-lysine forming)